MSGRWLLVLPALLALALFAGSACVPLNGLPALPGLPGFGSAGSEASRPEATAKVTHKEKREESSWSSWGDSAGAGEAEAEAEEPAPPPARKKKGQTVAEREVEDIGATCNRNTDCEAKTCYTYGNGLGYCTKMCNSWSDCPSHWDCRRPGNAPQQICIQDT